MNQIQIFSSPQFGEIRTTGTHTDPWFCLADICRVLELQTGATKNRLNQGGISLINTPTSSGEQQMIFINEQNLYKLIMRSDKPQAEPFQDWVCGEVLTTIRRHGAYFTPQALEKAILDPDYLIRLANTIKEERAARIAAEEKASQLQSHVEKQQKVLQSAAPKVAFAEAVGKSDDSISIDLMAKLLAQNGVEIGEKRLFKWLRDNLYISDQKKTWNRPYQKWIERGYFRVETSTWKDTSTGNTHISYIPRVTVKGQRHLVSVFCNKTPQLFGNIFEVQSANA